MPKQDVMIAKERTETPVAAAEGTLAVMILLLAGSGCAALIYEIVWFQLFRW